jgi:hypothetical protein
LQHGRLASVVAHAAKCATSPSLNGRRTSPKRKSLANCACHGPPCTPLQPMRRSASLPFSHPNRLQIDRHVCRSTHLVISSPALKAFLLSWEFNIRDRLVRNDPDPLFGSMWLPKYLSLSSRFCSLHNFDPNESSHSPQILKELAVAPWAANQFRQQLVG